MRFIIKYCAGTGVCQKLLVIFFLPAFLGVLIGPDRAVAEEGSVVRYVCRVKKTYPHDTFASTQGLLIDGELLYESTGKPGTSSLRLVDLNTGRVLRRHDLPEDSFGEGIALQNSRIYQLTWRSGTVFLYDRESFRVLKRFKISTEGWGLTSDERHLIMSDGTAVLRFLEPESLMETARITVHDEFGPVEGLNELEFVRGLIFANIYFISKIVMIDPVTGKVVGRVDLGVLANRIEQEEHKNSLNGIAYDPLTDRLLLTGKRWPWVFEVELIDAESEKVFVGSPGK